MKRIVAIILTLVMLLTALTGCAMPFGARDHKVLSDLSEYLNDIQFVPGLSQSEFTSLLEQCTYNGTMLTEIALPIQYDGTRGGGLMGSAKEFGFHGEYKVNDMFRHATYTNSLYTEVQLEGFRMPYDIELGDSLEAVMEAFGIAFDPQDDFKPDKIAGTDMTLYKNNDSTLVFRNLQRKKKSADDELPFVLIYTEKYYTQYDQLENRTPVKRVIRLHFDAENATLTQFEVSVKEVRALRRLS